MDIAPNIARGGKKTVRITASINQEQYDRLSELAAKNNVSVAWLMRLAVDRLFEQHDGGLRLPFEA